MPDNAADLAADYATTHGFKILRVGAGMRKDALAVLQDLEQELEGTLAKLDATKLAINGPRYKALLTETKGTISDAYKLISKNHGKGLEELAGIEWQASEKMLNTAIGVELFGSQIPAKLLEAVTQAPIILGHSSKDWWAGQAQATEDAFRGEMAKGILLGETTPALIKRLKGAGVIAPTDPTAPKGILAKAKRDAEALVLSSTNTVANHARLESFKAKPNIIKGVQWLSTLDSRTTMICMALDGKQWRLPDFQPVGHTKTFPGPTAHWRCRSTQISVLYSWSELAGKPIPELDDATLQEAVDKKLKASGMTEEQRNAARVRTRASMDGQVGKHHTYGTWAEKKGAEYITEVLGPGRAALYNAGQMTFSDLTDQNNRPITLAQHAASVASGKSPPETLGFEFPTAPKPSKFIDLQAVADAAAKAAVLEEQAKAAEIKAALDAAAKDKIESYKQPGAKIVFADATKQILKTNPPLTHETLLAIHDLAEQKKIYNAKIGTIAGIKKKWLAGQDFTPAQQAVWDAMTPDEAVSYMTTWDEIKGATLAKEAAEKALKLAEEAKEAAELLAKQQAAAAAQAKADALEAAKQAKAQASAAKAAAAQAKAKAAQDLIAAKKQADADLAAAKAAAQITAPATKSGAHKAPATRASKPTKPLANKPTPHPDELSFVRSLGGTTGAELHKDNTGALYVVKRGAKAEHVREEAAADDIYRALGVRVPDGTLHETKLGPTKVTRFEADAIPLRDALADPARRKAVKAAVQEDFAVDVLLGNWDVAGADMDNILVTATNKVIRIDNGGSLRYRAMGTAKMPDDWDDTPTEIFTMRRKPNPSGLPLPPDGAHHGDLFGDADWLQIAKRIESIDRETLALLPIDTELKLTLLKRHEELAIVARRTLNQDHDGWKADFAERQAALSFEFKAKGIREAIPNKIEVTVQGYGDVIAKTDGAAGFGRLRTDNSGLTTTAATQAASLPSDNFYNTIKIAVTNLNYHAGNNGTFNATKIDNAIALKPALEKIVKSTKNATAQEKEMAKKYLEAIKGIEKAKKSGGAMKQAQFDKYLLPTPAGTVAPKPVKTTSIVGEIHNLMIAKHGAAGEEAMNALALWMVEQAGNSWNNPARVAKHWMAKQTTDPHAFYWGGNGNGKAGSVADAKKHWDAALATMKSAKNAKVADAVLDDAFMHWHTMTQDVLTWADMPYNDRARGVVRLVRTESKKAIQMAGTEAQGIQRMQRGAVESHAIFNKVTVKGDSSIAFWTATPHHRVLGTYLTEKRAGNGGSGFAGNSENEFAANTNMLPSLHQSDDPSGNNQSTKASEWGVPLNHLRK